MAIRNVCNVLVASTKDAGCPWGSHGKIKLLEVFVKVLWIISVIDIHSSSATVLIGRIPILDDLVASVTSWKLPRQKIYVKNIARSKQTDMESFCRLKNSQKTNPWGNLFDCF